MKDNKLYENVKRFIKCEWKFIIVFIVILLLTTVRLPYEVEMPGGTISLNDRVKINGNEINASGTYNMAYVTAASGTIPYVLIGLINPDWEVVKISDYTASNEDMIDYINRNKVYLKQSQSIAKLVALKEANIDYEINKTYRTVIYVSDKANTTLKNGDEILKVDNLENFDDKELQDYIQTLDEETEVKLKVLRNNKETEATAKIFEEDNHKYMGITIAIYYDIESDYDIEIESKNSESGPSGGMMTSLMVYSGLTNKDLTKGKKIVGTGTISTDGTVGEIGGVKYKLMGAVKNKADIFLVPKENYEEAINFAKQKKYDITIVSVETLKDAIDYLEGLDE